MKVRIIWKISDSQLITAVREINKTKEPREDGIPRFIWWIVKYVYAEEDSEKSIAAWQMAVTIFAGEHGKLCADILADKNRLKSTILGLPYEVSVPNDVEDGIRAALKSCRRIVCNDRDMQSAIKEWLLEKYGQPCEAVEILGD